MPRTHKKYTRNFTTISSQLVRDTRLSYKARGILLYLWHLPDDWDISLADLQKHSEEDGQFSVRTGVAELQKYGYIVIERVREKGIFVDTSWVLDDEPSLDFPTMADSILENPSTPKDYLPKTIESKNLPSEDIHTPVQKNVATPTQKKPRKTTMPDTEEAQAALYTRIIDAESFQRWLTRNYGVVDGTLLLLQWEYFVSRCLAKAYDYADWSRAFQHSFTWEKCPVVNPPASKSVLDMTDEEYAAHKAAQKENAYGF